MPSYEIRVDVIPPRLAIYDLYKDAGWKQYCDNLSRQMRALENSLCVVTAWQGELLCGLCRAVGDRETILFLQDLLVLSGHRRRGVGKTLLRVLLDQFPDVARTALLTDDTRFLRDFYRGLGFLPCEGRGMLSFFHDKTAENTP